MLGMSVEAGQRFDEKKSMLTSKWGIRPLSTKSFAANAAKYGRYKCYVKKEYIGCCPMPGENEDAPVHYKRAYRVSRTM